VRDFNGPEIDKRSVLSCFGTTDVPCFLHVPQFPQDAMIVDTLPQPKHCSMCFLIVGLHERQTALKENWSINLYQACLELLKTEWKL